MIKNKLINKKNTIKNNFLILFSIFFAFILLFSFNINSKIIYADDNTTAINNYLNNFYVSIENDVKNRTAGGVGEKFMANTLATYMTSKSYSYYSGLTTYLQEFAYGDGTSNNVVGVIDRGAENYVILGAHYDSVYIAGKSYGYSDNMSGVVACAITAEKLATQNNFNVILAFWGAEETGCNGSMFFAKNLPTEIRENTLLYVNFDSVGAGDYLYYYHSDFPTNYGSVVDKFYKDKEVKKYGNELYGTNANLNINYTNLGLQSDNSSFLKQAVNSLFFFAGNLETNNGLGYFETVGHDKIMHNTDTKATIDEVFGDDFVANIDATINLTTSLLLDSSFTETNFASGQVKTFLYVDWILKGAGVVLVGLLFIGYIVYSKVKKSK